MLDGALVHIDELAARSGRPVSGVLALLSSLEIAGVAEQHPGRHFRRERRTGAASVPLDFPRARLHTRPVLRPALQLLRLLDRGSAPGPHGRLRPGSGRGMAAVANPSGMERLAGHRHHLLRRRDAVAHRSVRDQLASFPVSAPTARSLLGPKSRSRPIPTTSPLQPRAPGVPPGSIASRSACNHSRLKRWRGCTGPMTPTGSRSRWTQIREAGITDLSLDLIFGLPAALDRCWETGSRARDRARSRASLSLRPHGRGAHAAGPLDQRGKGDAGRRRPVRDRIPLRPRSPAGGRIRPLRGLECRETGSSGTPQLGLLAAGAVHRPGSLGPQRIRRWNAGGISASGRPTTMRPRQAEA